jgi:CBS domain containing-hemolysin-like protein
MNSTDVPLLLLLLVALVAAAFLAAAEASLLRISEFRARSLAEDEDDPAARRLRSLLARLPEVLNLILLLALLAQIGAAAITGFLAQRRFGNLGVTIASVLLTIVLFVYGEAIPKTFAIRHAERTALWVSGPVSVVERLLRPVVSLLVWIADLQLPGKGIEMAPTVTESELLLLAGRAAQEGEITGDDRTLIERVFVFGDRRVDDIMIPRPDIVALEASAGLDEAIEAALLAGHRRLPIYEESLEDIVGVVKLRDMIAARDTAGTSLIDLAFPPLLVPESKTASALLEEMQATRTHLAIVVDEYGVTTGLVTVEDVAEELLGTISDDQDAPEFEIVGPGRWRVAGSLPVEDLERTGMNVPEGDWNTVAGLVVGLAGQLAEVGDVVEADGFRLRVEAVTRRRITRVWIEDPS